MRAIDRLQRDGLRRAGTPRSGFRLAPSRGQARPAAADLARLRALRLPPAWTDVFVARAPGAKLQAIGRDRAGRWQYRYHPDFVRRRAAAKYRRLLRFAAALPRIRAAVHRDLRRPGLGRERVLAAMVRIVEACFMRPGSEAYAVTNRSYGVATLRPRHVTVVGDRVVFDYRGQSGQRQVRELCDARVARLVRALLEVPGRDLFKFEEAGALVDVRRRHLNAYLREIAGAPFTAKDFRTWAGTVLCASELARRKRDLAARASRKRAAAAAVKAVAERLGNTPAVARSAYVSPAVLDAFACGRVIAGALADDEALGVRAALCDAERALVALLGSANRRPARLRLVRGGAARGVPADTAPVGVGAKPVRLVARRPEP
jgi:DNA topoisomerase-1